VVNQFSDRNRRAHLSFASMINIVLQSRDCAQRILSFFELRSGPNNDAPMLALSVGAWLSPPVLPDCSSSPFSTNQASMLHIVLLKGPIGPTEIEHNQFFAGTIQAQIRTREVVLVMD
jgi:hypothetical protein